MSKKLFYKIQQKKHVRFTFLHTRKRPPRTRQPPLRPLHFPHHPVPTQTAEIIKQKLLFHRSIPFRLMSIITFLFMSITGIWILLLTEPIDIKWTLLNLQIRWVHVYGESILTEIPVCKQCKPWSDAISCGICSESVLFPKVPFKAQMG